MFCIFSILPANPSFFNIYSIIVVKFVVSICAITSVYTQYCVYIDFVRTSIFYTQPAETPC
jgi:hypothetical protein